MVEPHFGREARLVSVPRRLERKPPSGILRSVVTDKRRGIVVDARPEPLAVDPERTAVIVVDMQNDFGAERGMFTVLKSADRA